MNLKKCNRCNLEKSLEDFPKRKDKSLAICRVCTRIRIKENYKNNKDHYLKKKAKHNTKSRSKNREFVFEYLKTHPCVDCNESDPLVLEFDHLKEKKRAISKMIAQAYSIDSIKKEIEKCEVRCANCHRRKTAKQFNWHKVSL